MVTTYFMLGIIFIIYEGYIALHPEKLLDSFKISKDENSAGISFSFLIFVNSLYTIWFMIGLIGSSQTLLFTALFILSSVSFIFKVNRTEKQKCVITTIDALTSVILLTTIVYRHFHYL